MPEKCRKKKRGAAQHRRRPTGESMPPRIITTRGPTHPDRQPDLGGHAIGEHEHLSWSTSMKR